MYVYIYPIIIWLLWRNYLCIFIFCAMLHCLKNGVITLKHFATQELFMQLRSNPSVTRGTENYRGVGKRTRKQHHKSLSLFTALTCSCYRKLNKTETDPTFQCHFKPIPKQNESQLSPKKCCTENAAQGVTPDTSHLPIALCSTCCITFHNHAPVTLVTQPAFYSLLTLIQVTCSG